MPDEKKYGTIVTDLGTRLIRDAVLEGQKINITTLAVGDGGGYYYQPTADMTELKNERWSGAINSVTVNEDSPNIIDVLAVIPSNVGGWTIREMCVKDEEGNMIAVCNTPDTEKVVITSGAAGEIEMLMHIEISNTGAITFIVDPYAITATKKDLREHDESQAAHKTAFDKKAEVTDLNNHVNNSDIHVSHASMENINTAISGLIAHTENDGVHITPADRAAWAAGAAQAAQAAADAAAALATATSLESRVARVEDGIFNNITGNPYLVSFDSLDGIVLTKGIWNADRQRIEC
jgi:phage-related tail fiber protein